MAAVSGVLFAIFLLFIVFGANGQSNQNVTDTGSSSSCICDLVVNGCDPNCCCDVDCSGSDKESFTECSETKNVIYDDRVCVSDQMIFIENVPFTTKNTGDGLFCIYHNNNKKQEEYSDVSIVMTNEAFTQSVNSRNLYSYGAKTDDKMDQEGAINYKVGDKISLVFPNETRGYLVLPTMLTSSSCNDYNAAGYFQDATTECVRSFSDLSSECSSLPTLSAASYYSNFQVAMSPQAFATSGNTTSNSSARAGSYNTSLLFTPGLSMPLLCREKTGLLNHCSFSSPPVPDYDMTSNTCENVVSEVSYTFIYSNETSDLKQLTVSFVFENIQENFVQKFSIAFFKEGQESVFTKSGNPGYILDQPILAGIQTNSAANKQAIILSTNKQEWLTIPKATLDGTCSSGLNERLSVTFKINMRSGCMIRFNQSSDCSMIQDEVYTALLGTSRPDHVASFGNSDVKNAADWVEIINNKPANQARPDGNGRCLNMVLGMSIEILFANVGYLAKPQPKIVGVRYKYEVPQTIAYQCVGQFCQGSDSRSQNVEVVSSVAFIDVSKPPISDQKSLPEFQSKAPSDFFHPFL